MGRPPSPSSYHRARRSTQNGAARERARGFLCSFSAGPAGTRFAKLCHARRPLGPPGASSRLPEQFPKPCVAGSSPAGGARNSVRGRALSPDPTFGNREVARIGPESPAIRGRPPRGTYGCGKEAQRGSKLQSTTCTDSRQAEGARDAGARRPTRAQAIELEPDRVVPCACERQKAPIVSPKIRQPQALIGPALSLPLSTSRASCARLLATLRS